MDIVIAAEKPSIAKLLSAYVQQCVAPEDIKVSDNPDQTGSFYIGWQLDRFVLSPDGAISTDKLQFAD